MKKVAAGIGVVIVVLMMTVFPQHVSSAPLRREIAQLIQCGDAQTPERQACADAVPLTVWDHIHSFLQGE